MGMKSTVAAAAAIVLALAATTASAGVVINQEVTQPLQPNVPKIEQTVMIQGHKQKTITGDRQFIIDLDAGKAYFIMPKKKSYMQMPFPPATGMQRMIARNELPIGVKKSTRTDNVAGYPCTDYAGDVPIVQSTIKITQCVASDAPGAKEYVAYQKALADKLKGTVMANKDEVPDGIPVLTINARFVNKFTPSPKMPPELAAKMVAAMAKVKPFVTHTTVTKIEVKDLPADTFVVPAEYSSTHAPGVGLPGKMINAPKTPATHGPSTKPAPPVAPATH
jgi:Domain of unknown function (DUF4412)